MSKEMTIYVITNKVSGKQYVGQTRDLKQRVLLHMLETRRDRSYNNLYRDINDLGVDNFSIKAIEYTSMENSDLREMYWIKELNTLHPNGYNLTTGGRRGGEYSNISKKRIGVKTKERWINPETAEKMLHGAHIGGKISGDMSRGEERVPRELRRCRGCGEEFSVIETSPQTYCAIQCSSVANFTLATKAYMKNRRDIHDDIGEFSKRWAFNNKDIISKCPFNKIASQLKPLIEEIEVNFGVRDRRVISKAICGKESRKEMLRYLKKIVND